MNPVHACHVQKSQIAGAYAVQIYSARAFDKHSHNSFGFGIMDAGGQKSSSGRGQVTALAGQIITTNPGEVHDGVPIDQLARTWRMVYVTPQLLHSMVGHNNVEITQPVLDNPLLHHAIDALFRHWNPDVAAGENDMAEELLAHTCGLLFAHHGSKALVDDRHTSLGGVRDCLLDQFDSPPTLQALADLAGLSRYQLVRQFAKVHGLPPFAWLLQQRLRHAQALIANGAPLLDAALGSGFSDQSHLTRAFARYRGFTPGEWQRAATGSSLQ